MHPKSGKEKTGSSQSLQIAISPENPNKKIGSSNVLSIDHAP
jgi:hypothetical protein